jgi:IS605 OrfB family transposase
VVGMDSNYRHGLIFSDGQQVAQSLHPKIQTFSKREKHTRQQIKEELAREIKEIDLSEIKTVVVEDLKRVKDNKRGTFSRTFNRRLSHWQYAYAVDFVGQALRGRRGSAGTERPLEDFATLPGLR